jgi:cellulose synthase/poly-beta-1,6-N-acetylglucosamine synthase-like glycosyltransferase
MIPTLHIIAEILQVILLIAMGAPVLYLLFFAVSGLFYRHPVYRKEAVLRRTIVMIPAYKEDGVIVEVAKDAIRQDYPRELFDVAVIADSLQPQTLADLYSLPVKVIEVQFEKSTKTRALNRAMELLGDGYEVAVILDADNLMAHDFLKKVNSGLHPGLSAVQGHRAAKNLDTPLAVLDAASEEINNHIFRKGHCAAGLSSAIIGSGMAFRYSFFKEMMRDIRAGFDKEIELRMLKAGRTIGYLDDAIVYDEKIRKAEAFTNQRRRWLSAQINYFRTDIGPAFLELFTKGNMDYFDKAVQFILPPRILLLGSVLMAFLIFPAVNLALAVSPAYTYFWLVCMVLCLAVFALAVPRSFYNSRTLQAMASLPKGMLLMLGALLKVKGANRQFLHTEHHPVVTQPEASNTQKAIKI